MSLLKRSKSVLSVIVLQFDGFFALKITFSGIASNCNTFKCLFFLFAEADKVALYRGRLEMLSQRKEQLKKTLNHSKQVMDKKSSLLS